MLACVMSRIALFAGTVFLLTAGQPALSEEFTEAEKAIIQSLSLDQLPAKPTSHSNRFADDPRAQQFGAQLFFEKGLSLNGEVACSSCHHPEKSFTDGLSTSDTESGKGRNAPSVIGSAWQRWFYWDGRKDSLWSQAMSPIETPNEMGSNRLAAVRYIAEHPGYKSQYEKIFGPLPDIALSDKQPDSAGPYDNKQSREIWSKFSPELKQTINSAFVNIGKALEAYQRTLVYEPTSFDLFARELTASSTEYSLNAVELAGLQLFINDGKTQCLQCHNGPLFTNGGFHNVGSGVFKGDHLDFGRMIGLQAVTRDEFNCLGKYSDADADDCSSLRFLNPSPQIPVKGAFKTPSLRNLTHTGPYFHDGRFTSLKEVIEFYNDPPANGTHELQPMSLTGDEIDQLVKFLTTLSK